MSKKERVQSASTKESLRKTTRTLFKAQIKKRGGSISKAKTKEESKSQVKWNAKLKAYVEVDGMSIARTPGAGLWFANQRKRLRDMAKKD